MGYATYYELELGDEYVIHFRMGDALYIMSIDEAQIFLASGIETLLAASRQIREKQSSDTIKPKERYAKL